MRHSLRAFPGQGTGNELPKWKEWGEKNKGK